MMGKVKSVVNISTEEINNCLYPSRRVHEFDAVVFDTARKVSSWSDIFEQLFRIPFKAFSQIEFLFHCNKCGDTPNQNISLWIDAPQFPTFNCPKCQCQKTLGSSYIDLIQSFHGLSRAQIVKQIEAYEKDKIQRRDRAAREAARVTANKKKQNASVIFPCVS